MFTWTLQNLLEATQGYHKHGKITHAISGFTTDSRNVKPGQVFVCLNGENFDGHDFIVQAANAGTSVIVTHKDEPSIWSKLPQDVVVILVSDTLIALQSLGAYRRRHFTGPVVGITGSNGKSSTKEFSKVIVGSKKRTHASPGSFNNHWGVPISILSMPTDCEVLILEMGMSALGEIATLCKIANPTVVVVTMVGSSHIGELGSHANIAKAKAEIYENSPNAHFIFNLDNQWTRQMVENYKAKTKSSSSFGAFSSGGDCTMRALRQKLDYLEIEGTVFGLAGKTSVPVFGRHNVVNLMAASCIAKAVGLTANEIWNALPLCKTGWGRNQLIKLPNGATVLFDGYNANPESMSALIKNIFETDSNGKKIAVLADMLELGSSANELHFELGKLTGQTDLDAIWFYGSHHEDFAKGVKAAGYAKRLIATDQFSPQIALELGNDLKSADIAVIKGSRGMKLERVLKEWYPEWKSEK